MWIYKSFIPYAFKEARKLFISVSRVIKSVQQENSQTSCEYRHLSGEKRWHWGLLASLQNSGQDCHNSWKVKIDVTRNLVWRSMTFEPEKQATFQGLCSVKNLERDLTRGLSRYIQSPQKPSMSRHGKQLTRKASYSAQVNYLSINCRLVSSSLYCRAHDADIISR